MDSTTGRTTGFPWRRAALSVLLAAVLAVPLAGVPSLAADDPAIGRLAELDPDGRELGAGRPVLADGRPLIVLDRPAALRLRDAPPLRLDANSALLVEPEPRGWSIRVLSGRVRLDDPSGRELIGGAGGRFVLPAGVAVTTDEAASLRDGRGPQRSPVRRALPTTTGGGE